VIPLVSGLFGLVIGSFLNVVIHRVPLHRSIICPSSSCPHCGARIKMLDNVPVLFYLLLRMRGRACGVRISPRYPWVEACTGVLIALAAYEFGISLALVWALVLIPALVTLVGIDFEYRLLPNVIVGSAALVGFALSVISDPGRRSPSPTRVVSGWGT
jgi:leader peptidase (prepilin peptidase)/N-methyltransferase